MVQTKMIRFRVRPHFEPDMNERKHSRRALLQGLGSIGALALLHCGTSSSSASEESSTTDGDAGTSATGTSTGTTTVVGDGGSFAADAGIDASGFATGSGAFLDGKDYGNPFSAGTGSSCTVYKTATKGPCHSNTYNRKDVSDGLVGLPTRFELLIVDASCTPIPNAIVEIWYASPTGTYSKAAEEIDDASGYAGSLSDLNVGFCTGNDATAVASSWLRGYQTSDANGIVVIDGIFPGWYSGRAPHVHFIITASGHTTLTSQVLFDETLTTEVYTKHATYSPHGDKDTTNASDNVGLGTAAVMSYAQQDDGAMVCWKMITVS